MKGFQRNMIQNKIAGYLLVSIGILLTASAGGWDITNHLLNKPESFLSPPHAALYTGVSMVIVGAIMIYICDGGLRDTECRGMLHSRSNRRSKVFNLHIDVKHLTSLPLSVKLVFVGVTMLVAAGPFDFIWHSAFGLDGLLSPPHSILTVGMALCSIGAFLGIITSNWMSIHDNKRLNKDNDLNTIVESGPNNSELLDTYTKEKNYVYRNPIKSIGPLLIVVSILPVWLTISGLIHMASLPFSNTPFFNFNPNPVLAVLIATICFPFLISLTLFSTFRLVEVHNEGLNRMPGSDSPWKERGVTGFGIMSLTGTAFIVVNIATSIIPNEHLISTLPFYVLNILPIIAADILLTMVSSNKSNNDRYTNRVRWIEYLAGGILGLVFFTVYFPLITHTYNEVLPNSQPVWPSLTSTIYFKMVNDVGIFLIPPGILMGILGVVVASKIFTFKNERQMIKSKPV
jgi:hypothetical protein